MDLGFIPFGRRHQKRRPNKREGKKRQKDTCKIHRIEEMYGRDLDSRILNLGSRQIASDRFVHLPTQTYISLIPLQHLHQVYSLVFDDNIQNQIRITNNFSPSALECFPSHAVLFSKNYPPTKNTEVSTYRRFKIP